MNLRFFCTMLIVTFFVVPLQSTVCAEFRSQQERNLEISYTFTIQKIPEKATEITAWIPIPLSNMKQMLQSIRINSPWDYTVVTEKEYGNRFIRFSRKGKPFTGTGDVEFAVTFKVLRRYFKPETMGVVETSMKSSLTRFLAPDSLVPVNGKIADEAHRVAGNMKGRVSVARKIYDHIVNSMKYDKTGKGWGKGNALYACDVRRGNCTDFHSLFIAEVRSLGIPARFIIGLPVRLDFHEGNIPGYHCWAEFYADELGWVPIDASEASKHPEKKDAYFGALAPDRVTFTIGRDIVLPGSSTGPLNYVIYPYVEIDSKPYNNVHREFSFREGEIAKEAELPFPESVLVYEKSECQASQNK